MKEHEWFMKMAIEESETAFSLGEVPVGAIIVDGEGTVLARKHNLKESTSDPCGHAEILALRTAAKELKNWRLTNCSIYITLEPCAMCMGAIVHSRIKSVYFGAYDKKGGALSLGYGMGRDGKLNHQVNISGGWNHFETSKILSDFFKQRRSSYNKFK